MEGLKLSLALILLFVGMATSTSQSEATKEILEILKSPNYYKEMRPPSPGPTTVTTNIYIRNLDLDDMNMELKLDLTFRMQWRDQRIRFTQPNVSHVTLTDFSEVWLPDPFFKNSVQTKLLESIHKEAYIRIFKTGLMLFSSRFTIHQRCGLDVRRFPHDTQECSLRVASYGYTMDDIVFVFKDDDPVQIKQRLWIKRFLLNSFKTDYCTSKTNTGQYSCLSFTFNIERVFSNYLMEWYMPCVCLVCVAFCSHLLSRETLLARLIVTLAPLMTLFVTATFYNYHKRASVSYVTAFDVFSGISFLAIFATLFHVIVAYYCSQRKQGGAPEKEENTEEETLKVKEPQTKKEKIVAYLKEKGDVLTRAGVVGGYALFIFLYLLAYST